MQEVRIYVSGHVQGVGFRAAVHRHASVYNITGYVCNLPDGRVEILAQGSSDQINQFIHKVKIRPGMGGISSMETTTGPLSKLYDSFEIR